MSDDHYVGPFLEDFFAESEEHAASLRRALLHLEDGARDTPLAAEHLRSVLRSLHTLKGLSGMVGFAEAERVAHAMEDWIRARARGDVLPANASVDLLFDGVALLERVLGARRGGSAPLDVAGFLARVGEAAPRPARRGPPSPATSQGAQPRLSPAEMYRLDAAVDAGARILEVRFVPTPELVARGVGVEAVRGRLSALGEIVQASPRVLPGRGVAFHFLLALRGADDPPAAWRDDAIEWSAYEPPPPPPPRPPVDAAASVAAPATTVRVELSRLDELMRLVGELVITRARLNDLVDRAAAERAPVRADALDELNGGLERQLRDLREAVMRVRLVPVGEVFERMRFVVRDVAHEAGKRVRVALQGQATEIDKLLVERMMEPLLHLVRNAVSHGIETPEARAARGKPAEGRLSLSATTVGERVRIQVEDDGAGIDRAAVVERARAAGIPVPDGEPDDAALLELLCAPGLSTRTEADLASGRGIGMDVVRSTIRALGGDLSLASEPGRGTRFDVELPLTLMIVDALLVRLGGQVMAVPQPALLEVVQVDAADVVAFENNEVVRYRGGVLPLLRLRRLFGIRGGGERPSFPVLVVGSHPHPVGLVVDRVAGLREIVVRSLADPLVAVPGIAGATELGDGTVCLILDASELSELARAQREAATGAPAPLPS